MQVLIATHAPHEWSELPGDLQVTFCAYPAEAVEHAMSPDTEVLVTDALPLTLEHCNQLRWVQLLSAGANQVLGHPLAVRTEPPVRFTSAAGISAVHIAEHVVARVLYHTKELRSFERLQREHVWPDRTAMARPDLRGKTALIVGYGGVGRETARLLAAFGMRILAVTRDGQRVRYAGYVPYPGTGDPEALLPEHIYATPELERALPGADVVILSVPLTDATHHLLDSDAFQRMRSHAILINVGRGAVLDTAALLTALDAGRLAHAYLDVFAQEPLPPDSELWDHASISITPHMAGVMPDDITRYRALFLQNQVLYRAGERMLNELDTSRFVTRNEL